MTARGGAALSILCEALVQQILVHNSVKIKNKHQFIANKPFTFLPFPKPRQHTEGPQAAELFTPSRIRDRRSCSLLRNAVRPRHQRPGEARENGGLFPYPPPGHPVGLQYGGSSIYPRQNVEDAVIPVCVLYKNPGRFVGLRHDK